MLLSAILCILYNTYSQSGIITTIAGNVIQGYSGDGGTVTASDLFGPIGVALDGCGNLYIADFNNDRVRKVHYRFTAIPQLIY